MTEALTEALIEGSFQADDRRRDSTYICPCCEKEFEDFVSGYFHLDKKTYNPSLYNPREKHVICPDCQSLPRHRLLTYYLDIHKEEIKEKKYILYFAIEESVEKWFKRNNIDYISADLQRPAQLNIDIEDTNLPSEKADLIICNHVLEHVKDFRKALSEMKRILTDDGLFICSFPISDELPEYIEDLSDIPVSERIKKFGQNDHYRIFGRDSQKLLSEAGFEVQIISGKDAPAIICPQDGPAIYDKTLLFACRKKK